MPILAWLATMLVLLVHKLKWAWVRSNSRQIRLVNRLCTINFNSSRVIHSRHRSSSPMPHWVLDLCLVQQQQQRNPLQLSRIGVLSMTLKRLVRHLMVSRSIPLLIMATIANKLASWLRTLKSIIPMLSVSVVGIRLLTTARRLLRLRSAVTTMQAG